MSWAAHQFEYYAIQAHMPKRWVGRISFLAIVVGDQTCDFFGKIWAYGIDFGGRHYGPAQPSQWHRGWPGIGFTHSIFWAFVAGFLTWLLTRRNRAWTLGVFLGAAAHAMTDITDSVGTMLAFPFSTRNFSVGAWAYAATPFGGKYFDGMAYYSSWGLIMDTVWLVLALIGWRCLTTEYWRTNIVPADPRAWAWIGRKFKMPERALVALYRAWFIYAVCRLMAWTSWSHLIARAKFDFTWGGPRAIIWKGATVDVPKAILSHPNPGLAILAVACALAVVVTAINQALKLPDKWWTRPGTTPGAEPVESPVS